MEKQKQTKESPSSGKATKRIAIIRIRGDVHMWKEIRDTLRHLNLSVVNNCVVIDDRGEYKGMIDKVKDYVTWGEIDSKTEKEKPVTIKNRIIRIVKKQNMTDIKVRRVGDKIRFWKES